MRARHLLEQAESEARRLAAASEKASRLFRTLGDDTASVLADRLTELHKLAREADRSTDRTRAGMATFLPALIEQLRTMTGAVEQLVSAGAPLLELGAKLERVVPCVN